MQSKGKQWITHLSAIVIAIVWFFRDFLFSGFNLITGDTADGKLILFLHEHWYRFFQGKADWLNTGMFYPVENTLGYSDTFFIQSLPYSLFRTIGFDRFHSFQLMMLVLLILGYIGMYRLLRNWTKASFLPCVLGSLLFCVSSPVFLAGRNSHIQLLSIYLIPWIILFFQIAWNDFRNNPKELIVSFSIFVVSFSLVAYSTFYVAWFALFYFCIFCFAGLFFIKDWSEVRGSLVLIKSRAVYLIPGILGGVTIFIPFALTYLPVRAGTGGRAFDSISNNLIPIQHLFNHNKENLLWGSIWPESLFTRYNYEAQLGMTPLFLLLLIVGSIWIFRSKFAASKSLRPAALAILLTFPLFIDLGTFSLWRIPYHLIPGGDAIRATFRMTLMLMIPAVVILVSISDHILKKKQTIGTMGVLLISLLLFTEQFQKVQAGNIDRAEEVEMFRNIEPLPDPEAIIFTIKEYDFFPPAFYHNTGTTLSQYLEVPTVNGCSGFLPDGWELKAKSLEDNIAPLRKWIRQGKIQRPVYIYKVRENKWLGPFDEVFPIDTQPLLTENILENKNSFLNIAGEGWSQIESWGVWSDGEVSSLYIPTILLQDNPIELNLVFQAFLNEERSESVADIFVDGKFHSKLVINKSDPHQLVKLVLDPANFSGSKEIEIHFEHQNPRSPLSYGKKDPRMLNIGLREMRIRPVGKM